MHVVALGTRLQGQDDRVGESPDAPIGGWIHAGPDLDLHVPPVGQMDEVLRNALESDPFKGRAQGSPDGGSTPDLPKPEVVPPAAPEIRA